MPVLLGGVPSYNPPPMVQLALVQNKQRSTVELDYYDYISVLLQELDLTVEREWILDVYRFAVGLLRAMDEQGKQHQAALRTRKHRVRPSAAAPAAAAAATAAAADADGAEGKAGVAEAPAAAKLYVQQMVLHPVKANVTIRKRVAQRDKPSEAVAAATAATAAAAAASSAASAPLDLSGGGGGSGGSGNGSGGGDAAAEEEAGDAAAWLRPYLNLTSLVDTIPLRFNALVIDHLFQTTDRAVTLISQHYSNQLLTQVYKALGSVQLVGTPVSVVQGIGAGVHDFFYEPLQGMVRSPEEFKRGLARGTLSLLHGSVGGVASFAGKVTGTLGAGVAALTMDDDYLRERARMAAAAEGSKSSAQAFVRAGTALGRGVVGGLTGVVMAPVRGARRQGVRGFVKGVGKGLVGVVLKPTVGVLDAVSNATRGIQQASAGLVGSDRAVMPVTRRRLPRAFGPGDRLVAYSPQAAKALQLLSSLGVQAAVVGLVCVGAMAARAEEPKPRSAVAALLPGRGGKRAAAPAAAGSPAGSFAAGSFAVGVPGVSEGDARSRAKPLSVQQVRKLWQQQQQQFWLVTTEHQLLCIKCRDQEGLVELAWHAMLAEVRPCVCRVAAFAPLTVAAGAAQATAINIVAASADRAAPRGAARVTDLNLAPPSTLLFASRPQPPAALPSDPAQATEALVRAQALVVSVDVAPTSGGRRLSAALDAVGGEAAWARTDPEGVLVGLECAVPPARLPRLLPFARLVAELTRRAQRDRARTHMRRQRQAPALLLSLADGMGSALSELTGTKRTRTFAAAAAAAGAAAAAASAVEDDGDAASGESAAARRGFVMQFVPVSWGTEAGGGGPGASPVPLLAAALQGEGAAAARRVGSLGEVYSVAMVDLWAAEASHSMEALMRCVRERAMMWHPLLTLPRSSWRSVSGYPLSLSFGQVTAHSFALLADRSAPAAPAAPTAPITAFAVLLLPDVTAPLRPPAHALDGLELCVPLGAAALALAPRCVLAACWRW